MAKPTKTEITVIPEPDPMADIAPAEFIMGQPFSGFTVTPEFPVIIWKALYALIHDPAANASHKTRIETGALAMEAVTDALAQFGYSIHAGTTLIPPGFRFDDERGVIEIPSE